MKKPKAVHAVRGGGGEYPYENEYILCDPDERYSDPKGDDDDKVTCKRCLKMMKKERPQ